jgi:hypothetical protein
MRRQDSARDPLPVSGDAKRPLPASRRTEHGSADLGRNRANPASEYDARPIHGARQGGAGSVPGTLAGLPEAAGTTLRVTVIQNVHQM